MMRARSYVALVGAQEGLSGPELLDLLRLPELAVPGLHLLRAGSAGQRDRRRRAQSLLRVHGEAFVQPRGNRQVAQAGVREFVGDDGFDGTQIGLDRHEVAAPLVDEHAPTARELPGLGVVVGHVPVVRVVLVEHHEDVVAPRRHLGDAIEDAHDPPARLRDELDGGPGHVGLQRREQRHLVLDDQGVAATQRSPQVLEPGVLAACPRRRLRVCCGDALHPPMCRGPVEDRQAVGVDQVCDDVEGIGTFRGHRRGRIGNRDSSPRFGNRLAGDQRAQTFEHGGR